MEYRKIGDNYYIRMDRGDEIISTLLAVCEKESIPSAVFSGIGGCYGIPGGSTLIFEIELSGIA
jgi:predicted DNA-binding protein with PD1-like motif